MKIIIKSQNNNIFYSNNQILNRVREKFFPVTQTLTFVKTNDINKAIGLKKRMPVSKPTIASSLCLLVKDYLSKNFIKIGYCYFIKTL